MINIILRVVTIPGSADTPIVQWNSHLSCMQLVAGKYTLIKLFLTIPRLTSIYKMAMGQSLNTIIVHSPGPLQHFDLPV